jgi:hypothetical protein
LFLLYGYFFSGLVKFLKQVQIDVSSSESILSAAAAVNKSLNGEKLFALVNNAGVGLQTAEGGADATMKIFL